MNNGAMETIDQIEKKSASPLAELLSGSAFHPHPLDARVPLVQRFSGKSLLLLMTARERAATVRVHISNEGVPSLEGARQIQQRAKGELVSVLKAEARACGASWVVLSLGSGWTAQYSNRSLRGGGAEEEGTSLFSIREEPSLFVPKPAGDCLYTAVDHPFLDRSLVFAIKRREVESLQEDIREAGLGLASVKLGIASLLEAYFGGDAAHACGQDLLLSDGLGVLLLCLEKGDFYTGSMTSGELGSGPRQYSNRPGDIAHDLARLFAENQGRALHFIGPAELDPRQEAQQKQSAEKQGISDSSIALFEPCVSHELHPLLEPRRSALPVQCRHYGLGVMLSALLFWGLGLAAYLGCLSEEQETYGHRLVSKHAELLIQKAAQGLQVCEEQGGQARAQLQWLKNHSDAQHLMLALLAGIPEAVALERMAAQVDESGQQMTLEFQFLGAEEAQGAAMREVERALLELGYRIGERNLPVMANKGLLHRWRLIVPPAYEEEAS